MALKPSEELYGMCITCGFKTETLHWLMRHAEENQDHKVIYGIVYTYRKL